jgi:high-affinity iron transporter
VLLNSVIIILREVLEAALLLSVFLACSRFLQLGSRWAIVALMAGLLGAIAYGYFLEPVSELFEGVGQEVCNASIQYSIFLLITVAVFFLGREIRNPRSSRAVLLALMAAAVAFAITREGAEILVYISGFWTMSDFFSAVGVGSLIGACIGFSVGVLFYYLLVAQPPRCAVPISVALLFLIAAGMASQATRLLIQADWLSTAGPLWNTSAILPEQSLPGQLLYALIGYEASPAAIEVAAHLGSFAFAAAAFFLGRSIQQSAAGAVR